MSYLCHIHADQWSEQCLHCDDVRQRNNNDFHIIDDYVALAQMKFDRYLETMKNKTWIK
jgi:hypothetical protein